MGEQPIVSVIIPTYGDPVFLNRAVQSVLAQTLADWELIIVDDNNPNTKARQSTEDIMANYALDARIHYVQHNHNKNGAAARNTAIAQAKGKYYSFLDSDDEYFPKRLEKCVDAMESTGPEVGGVYTGCRFVRGGKHLREIANIQSGNFLVETLACTFMFCTGSNIFMRGEVVKTLQFDEKFIRHQDYEFLVRFFENYSLIAIPEVLVLKNNENINLPNVKKSEEVKKMYLGKYKSIIESQITEQQKYIYRSNYISLANLAAMAGQFSLSKQYWQQAKTFGKIPVKAQIKVQLLKLRYLLQK